MTRLFPVIWNEKECFLWYQCSKRNYCSNGSGGPGRQVFEAKKDRFNCVTIDLTSQSIGDASFDSVLDNSVAAWRRDGCNAVWLHVPIHQSHLIVVAARRGFTYHHAEDDLAVLSLWLQEGPSRLPAFASHTVGVAGLVLNEETRELLMIQDKNALSRWKFPGGFASLAEDIPETAMREVYEETGIKTEFQGVLAFRQQHKVPSAFGRSDIYVVTRLRPLTFDINICTTEVSNAGWIPVEELTLSNEHTPLTCRMAKLIRHGLAEGFDKVDVGMHELPSVYKGMTYKLFHRYVPDI
ncbi:nucleoside diphosphate-linked moiety X motif 6-like [Diadema setosum]|uniref:nucleoside diphosphate-linked moiety X motif 6-like n=1 Tax=Diadema setosum TaxID=31175 RepID=UPI003B3B088A